MIRQGRGKEPAGLRLFPKGDKYRHSDSIIRSSRIVCGAYAIRPYRQGWRFVLFSPFLSLMKEKEKKENQGVRDAGQIGGYGMRLCNVPGPFSQSRQGPSGTPAKFAEYGLLMYPASFPAPAEVLGQLRPPAK